MAFICPKCKKETSFTLCGEMQGYVEMVCTAEGEVDYFNENQTDWVGEIGLMCDNCYAAFGVKDGITDPELYARNEVELIPIEYDWDKWGKKNATEV